MRPIRDKVIEKVNNYILEELEDMKLELIVEGINIERLKLTEIDLVKVDTNKHSSGYNEYLVYRHTFRHEEEEMYFDVAEYNAFAEAFPVGGYEVYYDTSMGTEAEAVFGRTDEIAKKLYKVLSEINYSSVFTEEIVDGLSFQQEYNEFLAKELKEQFLDDIPGVKDMLPGHDVEIVELVFDNGFKCSVNTTELRRNMQSIKLNQS